MARSRTIKPGFFTNEDLVEIEPLGRLLFIGLWTLADREGRLVDRPRKIKMNLLPCDNCDADALLQDLANAGFIIRYEVNGERYIQISNFTKHQNIHPKEVKSNLPPIPGQETDEQVANESCMEQKPRQIVHAKDESREITRQENGEQVGGRGKQLASQSIPSFPSIPSLPSSPSTPSCEVVDTSLPKEETEGEEKSILSGKPDVVREIVDYLNGRTGAAYRAASKKTRTLIKARLKEGFSREDFFSVIDKKAEEWSGTEFQAYLRPETLFGTKFESYLNQKVARKRPGREPPMNLQIAMALRAIEMLDGGTDDDAGSENY